MPEYVTREEFEARVGVLEQEVDGEKLVTRHVLEQTRRNGDDLAAIKTRLDRVETELGGIQKELGEVQKELGSVQKGLGGVQKELGGLKGTVQGLVKSLPKIISEAMREVLSEQRKKP